jgi:hypothetical protein
MSDLTKKPYPRDEIVAEVRAARLQLEAQAGGDLDALIEILQKNESARGRRPVSLPRRRVDA